MRGLLYKDLCYMRAMGQQLLLMLAAMLFMSFFMKNTSLFLSLSIMYCGMMVLTAISFDEACRFEKYALTLPVTPKSLVNARYALLCILLLVGFTIGLAGSLLLQLVIGEESFSITELLVSGLGIVSVLLMCYAVVLPLIFRFGVERSRLLLVLVYLTAFALVYGALYLGRAGDFVLTEELVRLGIFLGAVGAVALLAISWLVSVRVVSRKEW